jgi:hypothetical protein
LSLETVLSVPSPDCDSPRLRESDDRDLFGGGKRMSSGLSKFSLDGRPDSYSSINETVSIGSESNRALLINLGLDGRKLSDFVFRFLAKSLT